jgi:hypothetical protein
MLATDKMSVVRTGRGYRTHGQDAAIERTARMRPSNGQLVQQSVPGTLQPSLGEYDMLATDKMSVVRTGCGYRAAGWSSNRCQALFSPIRARHSSAFLAAFLVYRRAAGVGRAGTRKPPT